ncbi:MAG: hypothetical protein ABSB09_03130 [Acidimicrobiales bacterium]
MPPRRGVDRVLDEPSSARVVATVVDGEFVHQRCRRPAGGVGDMEG